MPIGTSDGQFFDNAFDQMHEQIMGKPVTNDDSGGSSSIGGTSKTSVRASKGQGEASNEQRDLTIIRHGATSFNTDDPATERVRGWGDTPLSDKGRQEAKDLGEKLKTDTPDVLVSSDLKRAKDTSTILSKAAKIPVEMNEGLRTWDIGSFEGKLSQEADPKLEEYVKDKPGEKVPGGESFNEFKHRIINTVGEVLDKYPDQHVGIVTHSKVDKLVRAWGVADFNRFGKIDPEEFNKKSEGNASAEKIKVPV